MTTREIDLDRVNETIERLRQPQPSYVPEQELLTAGTFVAEFGSLGRLFPKHDDLHAIRRWPHDARAAWGLLSEWSVMRRDPRDEPHHTFEQHIEDCGSCDYLEKVHGMWMMDEYERCEECGLDLVQHVIAPDPIGNPHAICGEVWKRSTPIASEGGEHGGDTQVSDAWDARWWARLTPDEDGTDRFAVITRAYYTAQKDEESGDDETTPLYIERYDEYLVCTDLEHVSDSMIQSEVMVWTRLDVPIAPDADAALQSRTVRELAEKSFDPEPYEWLELAPEFAREDLVSWFPGPEGD